MVRPYCAMPIGIETTDHHLSRTIIRTCREKIRVACSLAAFSGGTQISHWQNGIDNRQQSLFFFFFFFLLPLGAIMYTPQKAVGRE